MNSASGKPKVFALSLAALAWFSVLLQCYLSLQLASQNGKSIGSSPQFFGANPAEVREGPMKGTRVLSAEEDLGRALVEFSSPRSAPTPLSALPRLAIL